ncbi:MAG: hypothetical protein NTX50_22070 [Candidatus Sumerlaeota bacterium]|nr:hypothetical protein [Candidatus Sumerlaeota bacterium]
MMNRDFRDKNQKKLSRPFLLRLSTFHIPSFHFIEILEKLEKKLQKNRLTAANEKGHISPPLAAQEQGAPELGAPALGAPASCWRG